MNLVSTGLFIAAMSVLNRIRGGGVVQLSGGRTAACAGMGAAAGLLTLRLDVAFITAGGLYLWAVLGWGLYFAAVTGQWRRGEVEIRIIDHLGLWLVPFVTETQHKSNYRRGIICFGTRALALSLPMFALLTWRGYDYALLCWPLFGLQGVVYWLFRGEFNRGIDPIQHAEYAWGAAMGIILALTLTVSL